VFNTIHQKGIILCDLFTTLDLLLRVFYLLSEFNYFNVIYYDTT